MILQFLHKQFKIINLSLSHQFGWGKRGRTPFAIDGQEIEKLNMSESKYRFQKEISNTLIYSV